MFPLSAAALVILTLAAFKAAATGAGSEQACIALKLNIPNIALNDTTYFPANATVAITTPQASINTTALPAFCRVRVVITTNVTAGSTAQTELWLPDAWNGRFLGLGNGGFSGGGISDLAIEMR